MVAIEPRLRDLLLEVRSVHGVDYATCPMNLWYGYSDQKRGLKHRLRKLAGDDTAAFWTSADYLYGQLRMCLHCLDRSPAEADLEWDLADRLKKAGGEVATQVTTRFGRADIVSNTIVWEIKLSLSRVAIFQAIGQASLYAHALGKSKIGIGGLVTPDTHRLYPALRELDIGVEVWKPAVTLSSAVQ